MGIGNEEYQHLRSRFDPESWQGANRLGIHLFVTGLALRGKELPGWRLINARRVELPDSPPIVRSLWSDPSSALLQVNVIEAGSRIAAHEKLLELLGNFEGPVVERLSDADLGDVAFSVGSASVVYAQGNLVVELLNAGGPLTDAIEVAGLFDRWLVEVPEGRQERPGGAEVSLSPTPVRRNEEATIELDVVDAFGRPVEVRVLARRGEIRLQDGRLTYVAQTSGEETLTVVVIDVDGAVSARDLKFRISR